MKKQTLLTLVLLSVLNGLFANEVYKLDSICAYQYIYNGGILEDSALIAYELFDYNDQNMVILNRSYELDSSDMTIKLSTSVEYTYDVNNNLTSSIEFENTESGLDSSAKVVNVYNGNNILIETTRWTSTSGANLQLNAKTVYILDENDLVRKEGTIEATSAGIWDTDTVFTIYTYDEQNRIIKKEPEEGGLFSMYETYTYTNDGKPDSVIFNLFGIPFMGFDTDYDYVNNLLTLNIFVTGFDTGEQLITPIVFEVEYNVDPSTVALPRNYINIDGLPVNIDAVPKKVYIYDTVGVDGALEVSLVEYFYPLYGGNGENPGENPQLVDSYENTINIYPAYVTNNVRIDSKIKIESIEIYDLRGQKIYSDSECANTNLVSKEVINKGINLIKVKTEKGEVSKTIIVE